MKKVTYDELKNENENLASENKNFAIFLEKLGYSLDEITNISYATFDEALKKGGVINLYEKDFHDLGRFEELCLVCGIDGSTTDRISIKFISTSSEIDIDGKNS